MSLTHAVAAWLRHSVPTWQHVHRRVLRELDIEFEPTRHWTSDALLDMIDAIDALPCPSIPLVPVSCPLVFTFFDSSIACTQNRVK